MYKTLFSGLFEPKVIYKGDLEAYLLALSGDNSNSYSFLGSFSQISDANKGLFTLFLISESLIWTVCILIFAYLKLTFNMKNNNFREIIFSLSCLIDLSFYNSDSSPVVFCSLYWKSPIAGGFSIAGAFFHFCQKFL